MKRILLLLVVACCCVHCATTPPKNYPDYSVSSGFTLDSLDAHNPQVIENLSVTCRVWGYAKYHHPVFAKATIHVDYELFGLLPQVAHADKAMRNRVLYDWVKGLGTYKSAKEKYDKAFDKTECVETADLGWTRDTMQLGGDLSALLQDLRYADRDKNRYALFPPNAAPNVDMGNESTVGSFDDCGYRILYLFRFWNIIEYYCPNRNLTETDWSEIPEKYLPLFIGKPSLRNPETCLLQRELGDSHATVCQYNMFGQYTLPVEVRNADNRVFVIAGEALQKGDEILSIDGREWDQTHQKLSRLEPASNDENRNYMAARGMALSHNDTATVEFIRRGEPMTQRIATRHISKWKTYDPERMADTANMRMIADGVGYMTGLHYKAADAEQIMEKFRDTKALIVDMRCYPREFMIFNFIGRYFLPQTTSHVTWVQSSKTLPGVFLKEVGKLPANPSNPFASENKDYYKGRVIVLVDSSTQSQAEYTVMTFQATPRCTVVGTQTAGADGNVSPLVMPVGAFGCFSGIGVLYPDGTDTQRAGVRIDVPVHASVEGLQAGRDEILEKALEIVQTGEHDPAN